MTTEAERLSVGEYYIKGLLAHPDKVVNGTMVDGGFFPPSQRAIYDKIAQVVARRLPPTIHNLREHSYKNNWDFNTLTAWLPKANSELPPPEHYLPKISHIQAQEAALAKTKEALVAISTGDLEEGRKRLSEGLTLSVASSTKFRDMPDVIESAVKGKTQNQAGLRFNWPTLDRLVRMRPGDVITVGAGTNVGKTSITISWLIGLMHNNITCCHISLEDSEEDTGERYASQIAGLDQAGWGEGPILSNYDTGLLKAANFNLPWMFQDHPAGDIDDVCNSIRAASYGGAKVVAVDYFQNIQTKARVIGVERYNYILDRLCEAAKLTGVVLLLPSQVKRAERKNKDGSAKILTYEDLAETSRLEKRSQVVVMMWQNAGGSDYTANISKNKRGPNNVCFDVKRDYVTGAMYERAESQVEKMGYS